MGAALILVLVLALGLVVVTASGFCGAH